MKMMFSFCAGAAAAAAAWLAWVGRKTAWGPFCGLYDWEPEIKALTEKHPAEENQHKILFYGASNFRLWKKMEEDISEYPVLNHGFGGSTDKLLVRYADRLLYPYHPRIVFLQTGSNDYVNMYGTTKQKIQRCMMYKEEMLMRFKGSLPKTEFVVMSGLFLPGRKEYTPLTEEINRGLKELCAGMERVTFVDASDLTYNGKEYREELFIPDGLHLNHEGQLLWKNGYILPVLKRLTGEKDVDRKPEKMEEVKENAV